MSPSENYRCISVPAGFRAFGRTVQYSTETQMYISLSYDSWRVNLGRNFPHALPYPLYALQLGKEEVLGIYRWLQVFRLYFLLLSRMCGTTYRNIDINNVLSNHRDIPSGSDVFSPSSLHVSPGTCCLSRTIIDLRAEKSCLGNVGNEEELFPAWSSKNALVFYLLKFDYRSIFWTVNLAL